MSHWRTAQGQVPAPQAPVRAAQYVRMSTEHQKYSTENQADIIAAYAAGRGFEIVETYADQGKSGLKIDGRDALKRLLADVQAGRADFKAILVYDVSRWGRFQDADESAYYEYLCREAGITVHYCAEQFENDGSLTATIIKGMKRAMAGEYSRELSAKVFTGQCRLINLGYRQGGPAGFGLRRQLVDEQRRPKGLLARGEHKSLQTDRVVLTAGPQAEIDLVQRIYRMFVLQRRSEREIAVLLNAEGRRTDLDRPWTRGTVHQVLTNEKYIGNNVYNRVSFKLKKLRVVNAPESWVRAEGAFDGIVDPEFFAAAQRIVADRTRRFTDEEMLERLTDLLGRKGCLSGLLIDEVEDMPSSSTYRQRFGTLLRAYQLVGYSPGRDYRFLETNRVLRALHPEVVARTVAEVERLGGAVRVDPVTDLLTVNEELTVSVTVIRCSRTSAGSLRWKVRLDSSLRPDITIAVRMDEANETVRDYYLLPWLDIGPRGKVGMSEANGVFLDAFRFDDLEPFYGLTQRAAIREAA